MDKWEQNEQEMTRRKQTEPKAFTEWKPQVLSFAEAFQAAEQKARTEAGKPEESEAESTAEAWKANFPQAVQKAEEPEAEPAGEVRKAEAWKEKLLAEVQKAEESEEKPIIEMWTAEERKAKLLEEVQKAEERKAKLLEKAKKAEEEAASAEEKQKAEAEEIVSAEEEQKAEAAETVSVGEEQKAEAEEIVSAEEEQKAEAAETVSVEEEQKTEEAETVSAEEVQKAEETKANPKAKVKKTEKKENRFLKMVLGFVALVAVLAFCRKANIGGEMDATLPPPGVLYAKENSVYLYNGEQEPYLLPGELSTGGEYHLYYTAWGAEMTENGKYAYYPVQVDESGCYSLYRKNIQEKEVAETKIADAVYYYTTSADGETVAYLAAEGDVVTLHLYDGEQDWTVAEGVALQEDVYRLSADGKHLVYVDAYGMLCVADCDMPTESVKLTDTAEMYEVAEDAVYFVAPTTETTYAIYRYAFGEEPTLVADHVVYMELLPNGKDLLYNCVPQEILPYADLIVDDMAESDAALQRGDEDYWNKRKEKRQRDEIREAMANGEGIRPILQECYLLSSDGSEVTTTLLADHVISAVALQTEQPYAAGYLMKDASKLPMSMIEDGLEEVEYLYYISLAYGGQEPFLVNAKGQRLALTEGGVYPQTITLSADGSHAAYLAEEETTGENVLYYMPLQTIDGATEVARGVETFDFLGESNELGYYYGYANYTGTLETYGEASTLLAERAAGIQYAEDRQAVYFMQLAEGEEQVGTLQYWNGKEKKLIDENVFAFFYLGNGAVVYLKEYDVERGVGNLFYFDGTEPHLVDTEITAIF